MHHKQKWECIIIIVIVLFCISSCTNSILPLYKPTDPFLNYINSWQLWSSCRDLQLRWDCSCQDNKRWCCARFKLEWFTSKRVCMLERPSPSPDLHKSNWESLAVTEKWYEQVLSTQSDFSSYFTKKKCKDFSLWMCKGRLTNAEYKRTTYFSDLAFISCSLLFISI